MSELCNLEFRHEDVHDGTGDDDVGEDTGNGQSELPTANECEYETGEEGSDKGNGYGDFF